MSTWNTENPPLDGTPIIAIGRILSEDDFSCCSDPFLARIAWIKDSSGYTGWHHDTSDQMVLVTTLEDEVKIDFWNNVPQPEAAK